MEHIIQFGVTIDDEAIKSHIESKATEAVVEEIKKELGCTNSWYGDDNNVIKKMVELEVNKQFEKMSDRIIEATSNKLTEKLMRTKRVREATQDVLDNVRKGGNTNG